jgi:hypothetical protein
MVNPPLSPPSYLKPFGEANSWFKCNLHPKHIILNARGILNNFLVNLCDSPFNYPNPIYIHLFYQTTFPFLGTLKRLEGGA